MHFTAWDELPEHREARVPSEDDLVGNTITDLKSTIVIFSR